nr:hypothetical protein DA06_08890 [Georgenia sp. SUBG003]
MVGAGHLVADVEGVTIARDRTSSSGHLIVSCQGNHTFQVYDLAAPHTWRKQFTVAGSSANGTDAVTSSDGVDVTRAALGTTFPQGVFVTHDAANTGGQMSNFKLVDAGDVLGDY